MYGISEEEDFSFLEKKIVEQLCLSPYQIILHFKGDFSLSIQCDFLHHTEQRLNSVQGNFAERGCSLISLLDTEIVLAKRQRAKELTIEFSNSEKLRVYDSSESYESFDIWGPDIEIIV